MLSQQSQSHNFVIKYFEGGNLATQIAQISDLRTVYSVRDTDPTTKDKAIVILE